MQALGPDVVTTASVTGTWDWASYVGVIGSATGEPGTVTADGTVRLRAKWTNNVIEDFIFQSVDGGAGSFDFTPTQGVTMKGEINGSGTNDWLLTFTQQ